MIKVRTRVNVTCQIKTNLSLNGKQDVAWKFNGNLFLRKAMDVSLKKKTKKRFEHAMASEA